MTSLLHARVFNQSRNNQPPKRDSIKNLIRTSLQQVAYMDRFSTIRLKTVIIVTRLIIVIVGVIRLQTLTRGRIFYIDKDVVFFAFQLVIWYEIVQVTIHVGNAKKTSYFYL